MAKAKRVQRFLARTGLCFLAMAWAFMMLGRMPDGIFCIVAAYATFGCSLGINAATVGW